MSHKEVGDKAAIAQRPTSQRRHGEANMLHRDFLAMAARARYEKMLKWSRPGPDAQQRSG